MMDIQTIINAMADTLEAATGKTIYEDEVKQGFSDRCFYINPLKATYTPVVGRWWQGSYTFDVIYYTTSKTEGYQYGEKLRDLLEVLDTEDGTIRGVNMSYQYIGSDAVHLYVTYNVSLRKPPDSIVKMTKLTTEEGLKNG